STRKPTRTPSWTRQPTPTAMPTQRPLSSASGALAWRPTPIGWQARSDTLMRAGHVMKSSGRAGGTFLTKGRTLYQLLGGILDGSLTLAGNDAVEAGPLTP